MVRALGDDYIKKYNLPDTQLGRLIRPEEIADAGWHPFLKNFCKLSADYGDPRDLCRA